MGTAQITRTVEADPTSGTLMHVWRVGDIAELKVEVATGEIGWVWTHEDHREQGHATALYGYAFADLDGAIFHAPESHRTDDGNRFAVRVGGAALACTCCAHLNDDYTED